MNGLDFCIRMENEMLRGTKVNLYKCFLSQTQFWANSSATFAFVHPDGVFNDSNGEKLREYLYIKLKYLFQFENEMTLFTGTNDHGRISIKCSCCLNNYILTLVK